MTSTLIEVHTITSYALGNLNRGESGEPKDVNFGGHLRARWSSQSRKRNMRLQFSEAGTVPAENLAIRTRRVVSLLIERLERRGLDEEQAELLAVNTVFGMGILDTSPAGAKDYRSNTLLYIADAEVEAIVDRLVANSESLLADAVTPRDIWPSAEEDPDNAKRSKRERKERCPAVFADLGKEIFKSVMGDREAIDLALFGRMIAEAPGTNVDGAVSVMHSFGVDRLSITDDFFAAVDDLAPRDDSGAGMIGDKLGTAPTLYGYVAIDLGLLARNLDENDKLIAQAVRACVHAAIYAQPSATHTGSAQYTLPSVVLATVRESCHGISLADAYVRVISPAESDVVSSAARVMAEHCRRLNDAYDVMRPLSEGGSMVGAYHLYTGSRPLPEECPLPGERLSADALIDRLTGLAVPRAVAS